MAARATRSASLTLAAALLALAAPAAAEAPALRHEAAIALAASPSGATPSLSYAPTFPLLAGRLHLGVGARYSAFLSGSGARFEDVDAPGAVHRLTVDGVRIHALNAMFIATVRLGGGFEAGFDIDLAGAALGPPVVGAYAGADPAFAGAQRARPRRWNLLLLGPSDLGQLDSQFFLAWWPGHFGLRAGLSHEITEYVTSRPLDGGNNRFRSAATRAFLAAAWRI